MDRSSPGWNDQLVIICLFLHICTETTAPPHHHHHQYLDRGTWIALLIERINASN